MSLLIENERYSDAQTPLIVPIIHALRLPIPTVFPRYQNKNITPANTDIILQKEVAFTDKPFAGTKSCTQCITFLISSDEEHLIYHISNPCTDLELDEMISRF